MVELSLSYFEDLKRQETMMSEEDKVQNQLYMAEMLLSPDTHTKSLGDYLSFLEDDFVKAQVVMAKMQNRDGENYRFRGQEDSLDKIKRYYKLKETMLPMSEERRLNCLLDITPKGNIVEPYDDTHTRVTTPKELSHKNANEMKKSLLYLISNPKYRDTVICSLQRYVAPELNDYVEATDAMIRSFFGELPHEQKEKLEISLRENDVYYRDYAAPDKEAQFEMINKDITFANRIRHQPITIFMNMLHEKAHSMSLEHYLQDVCDLDDKHEEGAANVAADLIAMYALEHCPHLFAHMENFPTNDLKVPFEGWQKEVETNFMHSLLYAIEPNGQDQHALKEYLLGSKEQFFDMVYYPGFTQNELGLDANGNPAKTIQDVRKVRELLLTSHPGQYSSQRESQYHGLELLNLREEETIRKATPPYNRVITKQVLGRDENEKIVTGTRETTYQVKPNDIIPPFQSENIQGFSDRKVTKVTKISGIPGDMSSEAARRGTTLSEVEEVRNKCEKDKNPQKAKIEPPFKW